MFGDRNQCNPIKGGSQIYYNYLDSISVRQMCPKLKTLKYREGCERYDAKTFNILNFFLKKGYVAKCRTKNGKSVITTKGIFNSLTKSYKDIWYLNKTRVIVNKECCKRFIKEKKPDIVQILNSNMRMKLKYVQFVRRCQL